jgi:hypothetical protein
VGGNEDLRTRPDDLLFVGQLGVFTMHFFPHLLQAFHPKRKKKRRVLKSAIFIRLTETGTA